MKQLDDPAFIPAERFWLRDKIDALKEDFQAI